jgi:hypothetical protein
MPASLVETLAAEVERVSGRLRSMSDVRLGRSLPDGSTRAEAARSLAQRLADAAQGVEQRANDKPPTPRVVPDLGVFAVGDQVAVTGTDLARAASDLPGETAVWRGSARATAQDVIAEQAAAVRALRLSL